MCLRYGASVQYTHLYSISKAPHAGDGTLSSTPWHVPRVAKNYSLRYNLQLERNIKSCSIVNGNNCSLNKNYHASQCQE